MTHYDHDDGLATEAHDDDTASDRAYEAALDEKLGVI